MRTRGARRAGGTDGRPQSRVALGHHEREKSSSGVYRAGRSSDASAHLEATSGLSCNGDFKGRRSRGVWEAKEQKRLFRQSIKVFVTNSYTAKA